MASAEHHSKSSVETWGGQWQDYFPIHNFFDVTRDMLAPYWARDIVDFRHRALRHHDVGMDIAEILFNYEVFNSDKQVVMVRDIAEQHMYEDFDRVPKFDDWWLGTIAPNHISDDGEKMASLILNIRPESWMSAKALTLHF